MEAGDFLEHATYSGHRYGTLRETVESRLAEGRSVVLEIEVQGPTGAGGDAGGGSIFIAPPDPAALRRRLEGRGTDNPEEIERRLQPRSWSWSPGRVPHVIVNDDVQKAASNWRSSSAQLSL